MTTINSNSWPHNGQSPAWWHYLKTILLVITVWFVASIALPLAGLSQFKTLVEPLNLFKLALIAIGGYYYYEFLVYFLKKTEILLIYATTITPLIMFAGLITRIAGVDIHCSSIVITLILIPAVLFAIKAIPTLLQRYRFFMLLTIFTSIAGLYFFVYKIDFAIPLTIQMASQGVQANKSMSENFMLDAVYQFFMVAMALQAMRVTRDFRKLFHWFNVSLSLYTLITAIIPLGVFVGFKRLGLNLEGIFRFMGIYPHPNYNAFYLGIISLYLLGIGLYFLKKKNASSPMLFFSSSAVAFLTSLFSLAKANLFMHVVCAGLIILAYLMSERMNVLKIVKFAAGATFLGGAILALINALTGGAWFEQLANRIDSQQSLIWRLNLWKFYLIDFDTITIIFGHGLASSIQKAYAILFSDVNMPITSVVSHNIFIQNIYEFGLFGLTQIMAMACFSLDLTKDILSKNIPAPLKRDLRFLTILQAVIFLYVIVYLCFNIGAFIYAVLYWIPCTILYMYVQRQGNLSHEK